jgi:hypothetical protein
MEGESIMNVFRTVRTLLFLGCAAPLILCARQDTQGDLPRPNPGTSNPDLQQQRTPKNGDKHAKSNDGSAGSSAESKENSSQKNGEHRTSKKSKKKHNQQTHGPQRHDPNGQS